MVTSCPHCGGALEGPAASAYAAAKVLYWLDVIFRLVAAVGVVAAGVWLFRSALWSPATLDDLWQERPGATVAGAVGVVLIGGFVAVHAAIRLILRRGPAASDERETTSQG